MAEYETVGLGGVQQPKAKTRSRKKEKIAVVCDQCGEVFYTARYNQKRCSWECIEQYLKHRGAGRKR